MSSPTAFRPPSPGGAKLFCFQYLSSRSATSRYDLSEKTDQFEPEILNQTTIRSDHPVQARYCTPLPPRRRRDSSRKAIADALIAPSCALGLCARAVLWDHRPLAYISHSLPTPSPILTVDLTVVGNRWKWMFEFSSARNRGWGVKLVTTGSRNFDVLRRRRRLHCWRWRESESMHHHHPSPDTREKVWRDQTHESEQKLWNGPTYVIDDISGMSGWVENAKQKHPSARAHTHTHKHTHRTDLVAQIGNQQTAPPAFKKSARLRIDPDQTFEGEK